MLMEDITIPSIPGVMVDTGVDIMVDTTHGTEVLTGVDITMDSIMDTMPDDMDMIIMVVPTTAMAEWITGIITDTPGHPA